MKKHIVCFGDSNTHGYCADPADCADGGNRFNEDEPVDLLVIMLGTNDTKERFAANAPAIAVGMERLLLKCRSTPCWGAKGANILVVCPPPLGEGFHDEVMGQGCVEKSVALPPYLKAVAERNGCAFLDAKDCEMNPVDFTHLTKEGHAKLAEQLAKLVPTLL